MMKTPSRPDPTVPLSALPCMFASLRRASRAITQAYEDALRPSGLAIAPFSLLMSIRRLGPVTQGALGDALFIDSTTLTRTLGPLIEAGWVARNGRQLSITDEGRARLAASEGAWKRTQRRLRRSMGDADWDTAFTLLQRLAESARTLEET